jgi:prepilin-type N-terminal cleavage/methylation domain-containing protein
MNRFKKQKGFTLIEMMVSVSIFVIVAFIVTSTLLTMSSAYKKAQKTKLLFDNLNFAIQNMTLGLREGKEYDCAGDSCSFVPIEQWLVEGREATCFKRVDRDRTGVNFGLRKMTGGCSGTGQDIISTEINITKLDFVKAGNPGNYQRITILMEGTTGRAGKDLTQFVIQSTVSQRKKDSL